MRGWQHSTGVDIVSAKRWKRAHRPRRAVAAAIESLEQRQLLSVSVSTAAATSITTTAATLNGTVNPHGVSATTTFQYGTNSDLTSTYLGEFVFRGVAVDSAGNVYGGRSLAGGYLLKMTPSGSITRLYYGTPLNSIATDAADDIFAATQNTTILEFPHGGGAMKTINTPAEPQGIGADSHGDIFFSCVTNGGSVFEIPAGSTTPHVLATGLDDESIAVDAAGDVFVPNSANTAILEIPHSGSIKTVASGFSDIGTLAVDGSGDLFVDDFNKSTISEVKPNQSPVVVASNISRVIQIAVSSTGVIYVGGGDGLVRVTPLTIAAKPSPVTGSSNVAISAAFSGLTPGATYYYRAAATAGSVTTVGSIAHFAAATATAVPSAATSVTTSGATLHATVNAHGSSGTTQFQISTSPTFTSVAPTGTVAQDGLAVDAAGNIYVVDATTSALEKIAPTGAITTLATGVPAPRSLAVDKSGDVFLIPISGSFFLKEYRPGKSTLTFNRSGFAGAVAVDGAGNAYVAEGNDIVEFPVSGPIKTFATALQQDGFGVDAAGDLFYAYFHNGAIEEIRHGGGTPQVLAQDVGTSIAVDGNGDVFTTPEGGGVVEIPSGGIPVTIDTADATRVATNAGGQVFVIDALTDRVMNITPLTVAGTPATATGTSNVAVSATVSGLKPKTTYYYRPVVKFNGTITFGAAGTFKTAALPLPVVTTGSATSITSTGATLNATANAEGQSTKTLFQISTSSTLVPTVMANIGSGFSEPAGVAVDSAGNVYVADDSKNAVYKIAPGGKPVAIGSGFNSPEGLAVDAAGDVFVADLGNNAIKEILPNGAIVSLGSGFNAPSGVAVDSAGDVFVADTSNSAVEEILPNGTMKLLGSGFSFPSGVAVDASGNVFVADTGNNAIKEIKTDGSVHLVKAGFSNPQGVAVDAAGDIFVGDSGHNAVTEILPNGTTVPLGTGLMGPFGVAIDSLGDVFIADQNDARAIELSHTTVTSTTLTSAGTTSIKGTLTGLKSKTKYYYRAIAISAAGTTLGQIQSFTTA